MSSEDKNPPASTEAEPFLARWARRKESVRQAEQEELPSPDALSPAEEQALAPLDDGAAESTEPERVLTDEDMPDIESLTPDSDVSGFFSPGVSEALRKKALRKLFHTSRFNVKDGLDDYDDDYTLLQPLGDTVPWDMKRQQERLEERRRRLEAEAANDDDIDRLEEVSETDAEAETKTDEPEALEAPQAAIEDQASEAENTEEPDNRA